MTTPFDITYFQKMVAEADPQDLPGLIRLNLELLAHLANPRPDLRDYKGEIERVTQVIGDTTVTPTFLFPVQAPLSADHLADAFGKASGDGYVSHLVMNAKDFPELRMFGRDILDLECRRSHLSLGVMGRIWGALVIVTRALQPGDVRLFRTTPEGDLMGYQMTVSR